MKQETMQISSTYRGRVSECDNQKLFLVNGVAVIGDSKLVIADGGNDRLCLYDIAKDVSTSIGRKGFGQNSFTEPIGVFTSDNEVYLTDWHNHRVVVFTSSLNYKNEVGHYGNYETYNGPVGKLYHVAQFLRNLGHEGIYFRNHLDPENDNQADGHRFSFAQLASGLKYWHERNGSLARSVLELFNKDHFLHKPNGVVRVGKELYVTQKDNHCVTVFEIENTGEIQYRRRYDSPRNGSTFGRLCNISKSDDESLYLCEAASGKIYHLTPEMELIETIEGEDMGTGAFIPFCCIPINEDLVVAGGGFEFQIINLTTNSVVHRSQQLGEVHGLAYDKRRSELYVADRSNSCVHRFSLQVE